MSAGEPEKEEAAGHPLAAHAAWYPASVNLREALAAICRQFEVEALYVFGSRAAEVSACVQGLGALAPFERERRAPLRITLALAFP